MFAARRTPLYRFLLLLFVALGLMAIDHRNDLFVPVRTMSSAINLAPQALLNLPAKTQQLLQQYYPDARLQRKYAALLTKQLELEVRLQRYDALQAENERLLALLSATRTPEQPGLLAEIIEFGLPPLAHRVTLNRGAEAGVYVGQPVLTPDGVLGQVSAVGVRHSVVTLLTDPSHAIPVQVQRNGLRTIAQGSGVAGQINVPFLPLQVDLHNADILLTSGMGGSFVAGLKVAQVQEVISDANEEFLSVHATPFANVKFTKQVLLLRDGGATATATEKGAARP